MIGSIQTALPSTVESLAAGWNLVGFPDAESNRQAAATVLGNILGDGNYAEIDGYSAGAWQPCAYDDTSLAPSAGGTSFVTEPGHGYAISTNEPVSTTL